MHINDLKRQYAKIIELLGEIFGQVNVWPSSNYDPESNTEDPIAISSLGGESASEETYPLVKRLIEYVAARPSTPEEEEGGYHTKQWLAFFDDLIADQTTADGLEVVHGACVGIPKAFFEIPDYLTRTQEFIFGLRDEEAGKKLPDKAAVSLSALTGVSWHIVYAGPQEFRHLCLQTERPVANAQDAAKSLSEFIGCKVNVTMSPVARKLSIAAMLLPLPEKMDKLRQQEWTFEATPKQNLPDR